MTGPEGPVYTPEQPSYIPPPPEKKHSFLRKPVGPGTIIAIVIGVVVVRGWLLEGAIVRGASMEPTLQSGERLLVLKTHYSDGHLPARGAIVIFPDPQEGEVAVKRVVGLPQEKIIIRGNRISIDGQVLEEPYTPFTRIRSPFALRGTIPAGKVWVMGDNRGNSTDSRTYGPIALSSIRGRAVLVIWPPLPRIIPKVDKIMESE